MELYRQYTTRLVGVARADESVDVVATMQRITMIS